MKRLRNAVLGYPGLGPAAVGRVALALVMAAGLMLFPSALQAQYDRPATAPAPSKKQEKQPPKKAPKKPAGGTAHAVTKVVAAAKKSATDGAKKSAGVYQAAPELGGPSASSGAIAIPHKAKPARAAPQPAPAQTFRNPPGLQHLTLRVNVPRVNVDVGVLLEKTHQFVPNLKKENFEVFENGVRQKVTHFSRIKAPITAVLLLEFARTNYRFIDDMKNAAYAFIKDMQPHDEVAVVTYALHTHIVTDFTQSRQRVKEALNSLMLPTRGETDMFGALYRTLDRLSRVKGRKYIILISSGLNTFSNLTLKQVLTKIRQTPGVTIYTISTGHYARLMAGGFGGMSSMQRMDFLQADNELRTFARMTGGEYFAPRFVMAMPDIFGEINDQIRNKYELTYTPTDKKRDGTYRHIQVRLVNDEGQPLMIVSRKHHRPLKYEVIAKPGYQAPLPVQ